jgi:hypothetical protein
MRDRLRQGIPSVTEAEVVPQERVAGESEQMDAKDGASALKLYVVGEDSPDPDTWSDWGSRVFVIASSIDEAIRLAGTDDIAAEVKFSRPGILCYEPMADGAM